MIVDTIFAGSDRNSNCILNSILASTSFFFKIELSFTHTGKVQNDSSTINTQGKRGLIFIVSNVKSLSLPMKICLENWKSWWQHDSLVKTLYFTSCTPHSLLWMRNYLSCDFLLRIHNSTRNDCWGIWLMIRRPTKTYTTQLGSWKRRKILIFLHSSRFIFRTSHFGIWSS